MTYRLRWFFDYIDRKPYYGVWGYSDPKRPAWCHAFEGIANALIQGKDLYGKVVNLAECSGQDFQNFQWIAVASAGVKNNRIISGTMPARLVGLKMQTRYGQICVYEDGTVIRNKTTYENIHFAAYGR